eukprot:5496946-Ditylum_brightwellii.AAC.1
MLFMRSSNWSGDDGAMPGLSIVVTSVSSTYDSAVLSILYFLHILVNDIPVHNACSAAKRVELRNSQLEGDDAFPWPSPNFGV